MKIVQDNLHILILSQINLNNAQTIVDHIFAFEEYSRHNIFIIPWMGKLPDELEFDRFDVIVVHYTVIPYLETYLTKYDKLKLSKFNGLKVGFRQDEYQEVLKYHETMRDIGFHLFYTCIPEPHIKFVYPEFMLPGVTFKNTLTGYVPKSFLDYTRKPISNRPIDIGYISRALAFWLGELGQEKVKINDAFTKICINENLAHDLSIKERDRMYGKDWAEFVSNCKCILGTESGASVLDFHGELMNHWKKLTGSLFSCENVSISFEEYKKNYLSGHQHHGLMNQISPRVFEAAALGTVLVLYEGNYSNILEANRHYIPVKKDYSNVSEVVSKIKNDDYLQQMADTTYREIACNMQYSYDTFVNLFDNDVVNYIDGKSRTNDAYTQEQSSALLNKYGYVNIKDFVAKEKKGIEGYKRPFDLEKLPYTHGKMNNR